MKTRSFIVDVHAMYLCKNPAQYKEALAMSLRKIVEQEHM